LIDDSGFEQNFSVVMMVVDNVDVLKKLRAAKVNWISRYGDESRGTKMIPAA